MKILVAYATHHGATREIAERIAETLRSAGLETTLARADRAPDAGGFDAFVVGSALYCGWLDGAADLVRRNASLLARRPVWLFSSGPLGTDGADASGRDIRAGAITRDIAQLGDSIRPRDHHVFFGAYDPKAKPVGLLERAFKLVPRRGTILAAGDFRDWGEIEGWARGIAGDLRALPSAPTGS